MRAEVLRRHAAGDGEYLTARDRDLERGSDSVGVQLVALEVLLHQCVVGLHDLVEELLAIFLGQIDHVLGDRNRLSLFSAVRRHIGAHVQDIDDAPQIVLRADGQMHGNTPGRKLVLDLGERTVEVGTLAVEHVDEEDTSQSELVSDLLHPGRADLEPHHTVDHDERALDDTQRAT